MELMGFVRSKSGLAKALLGELRDAFERHTPPTGVLAKHEFDGLVREIMRVKELDESEKAVLAFALSRVFYSFDVEGRGTVPAMDLFTALGVLVSNKGLAFTFQLADANQDGYLSPSDFFIFTRSFLTLVLALNKEMGALETQVVRDAIDATSSRVVQQVFEQANTSAMGKLTWNEFSNWYKDGGHLVMPWISLMQSFSDSNKTVPQPSPVPPTPLAPPTTTTRGDQIIYEFALAKPHGSLIITKTDVDNLEHLITSTKLYQKDPERVLRKFLRHADSTGCLSKDAFLACALEYIPSATQQERKRVLRSLDNIFGGFDRSGKGSVRLDEFCTGFSLLCAGSKSQKLQLTFGLFDSENKGSISPKDFARFIRSVLTALFALNGESASRTAFQVYEAIDHTASAATKALLVSTSDSNGASRRVTFEDFAAFYNTQQGNELISFVELLDLSKFPFGTPIPPPTVSPQPPPSSSINEDTEECKQVITPATAIFSFDLLPKPERLDIRLSDAIRYETMLNASQFHGVEPDALHRVVSILSGNGSHHPSGRLTKANFDRTVRRFVKPEGASVDEQQLLSEFFNGFFYAFDRQGTGEDVSAKECACGLSILCSGKKSDKLALGFVAYDEDGDGVISVEDLARFLRSFLTGLMVLIQREDDESAERLWEIVDTTSLDLAAEIRNQAVEAPNKMGVSFDDFAKWYGRGGFKRASFMELLDHSKWPMQLDTPEIVGGDDDEDEVEELDEDTTKEKLVPTVTRAAAAPTSKLNAATIPPVFVFTLTKKHTLEVRHDDVEFVRSVVEKSGLKIRAPEEAISVLIAQADYSRVLDLDDYKMAMLKLISPSASVKDRKFCLDALSSIYEVCDRDQLGCDITDLFGVVMLCGGSKSTKLACVWNAIDSDHDGDLTRTELYRLIRAFLVVLFAFNYGANSSPVEQVQRAADEASQTLAANIFLSSKRKKKDTVSFEEFAEFYSEGGGYRIAPWLELLNLPKFLNAPVPESSGAPPAAAAASAVSTRSTAGIAASMTRPSPQLITPPSTTRNNGDAVVFAFQLVDNDETKALYVTKRDVQNLLGLISHSKFGSINPEALVRLIDEQVDASSRLSEQGFGTFIGAHVLNTNDASTNEAVASTLYRLFNAFDFNGDGYVEALPFTVGLSLLSAGSKSTKLNMAWQMFSHVEDAHDETQDSALDVARLTLFFESLLRAISCFAGNCVDDSTIRSAARLASERVFNEARESTDDRVVTFDCFAAWYTSRGFESLSWIELLSTSKWKLPGNETQSQQSSHL